MADATSILETLWARIIERIGSKVSEAAQAASDASSEASKAQVEGDRAKSEADKAAASAAQAAETASSGVPDATDVSKGKVQLAGDLAGTADAPTVPGLAAKLDKSTAANVMYGNDGAGNLWMYPIIGASTPTANSVPIRTTGAVIRVGTPTGTDHATTKKYVDARPALFSGAGAPPAAITGAVVGDWWLNTSTMELSKITGV